LKWAFVETANLIVVNQRRLSGTHVARLYQRIKTPQKIIKKAAMAVARHLGGSSWWVLTRQEVLSRASARAASSFVDALVSAANLLADLG